MSIAWTGRAGKGWLSGSIKNTGKKDARRDEPGPAIQIILQCRLNIDRPIIQIILRCRLKIDIISGLRTPTKQEIKTIRRLAAGDGQQVDADRENGKAASEETVRK